MKKKNKTDIIFEISEHPKGFLLEANYGTQTFSFLFPTLKAADMFIENFKKELVKKGIKRNPLHFN